MAYLLFEGVAQVYLQLGEGGQGGYYPFTIFLQLIFFSDRSSSMNLIVLHSLRANEGN